MFTKGISGNPLGKPKGAISITSEIRRKLQTCPEGQKKTYLELMVSRMLQLAIVEGDSPMLKTIWEMVDGKAKQPITGGDGDDEPIRFIIERAENKIEQKSE